MRNFLATNPPGGYSGQNYPLSLIRLISLIFIIICHIMQHEDFILAWWFNVGVQIFLCISGYLYGQKNTGEITSFYGKRFLKILVPYYIVFIVAGILEVLFFRNAFSIARFGAGLVCRTTIAGGEHLWFVPVILFCYVITPILGAYRDRYIKNNMNLWIGTIIAVVVVSIYGGLFSSYFNPAWLSCYVIGYALGVNEDKKLIKYNSLLFLFGVLAFIGNGIQIYCDYVKQVSFSGYIGIAYGYFKNYNHVLLGVFLFLFMKTLFDRFEFSQRMKKFLNLTDKYSYETYLVHQFLILGPFSLMALTTIIPVNIGIILICIGIMAWVLKRFENLIMKKIS